MGCRYGRLSSPVREHGRIRRCKLRKKTHLGRKADRVHRSGEFHERRYRRDRRTGKR